MGVRPRRPYTRKLVTPEDFARETQPETRRVTVRTESANGPRYTPFIVPVWFARWIGVSDGSTLVGAKAQEFLDYALVIQGSLCRTISIAYLRAGKPQAAKKWEEAAALYGWEAPQ